MPLTQLYLKNRTRKDDSTDPNSSLWEGVTELKDFAEHYAKYMKWECPSLIYVRIGNWAWQIFVALWNTELALLSEGDIWDTIKLYQLEKDMRYCLLSYLHTRTQAGIYLGYQMIGGIECTVHQEWGLSELDLM